MENSKLVLLFASLFFLLPLSYADELTIPVLVGQTGASVNFGKQELDAYTLAVEEWNQAGGILGKTISLQVEDTQTSLKQIFTAFQRLILNKAPVILGPTWLDGFQAEPQEWIYLGALTVTKAGRSTRSAIK